MGKAWEGRGAVAAAAVTVPASGKLEIRPSEAAKNGRVVIHQPMTLKDGGVWRK